MRSEKYELRADERSRFEQDLFMPMAAIVSTVTIVLYATATAVPGQFTGRGFHIPLWGALIALAVLLAIWVMRLQRVKEYLITDEGLQIALRSVTYSIPFADIAEVVSVADRRAQPLMRAVFQGSARRLKAGLDNLLKRVTGAGAVRPLPIGAHNFTTSDTGGAEVICKNGARALVSPLELSDFLKQMESEFSRRGLSGRVVREVAVKISFGPPSNPSNN